MPNFFYKAKNQHAETVSGQIYAEDRNDAIDRLHRMGFVPVSVDEKELQGSPGVVGRPGPIRSADIFLFSRQLVSLIKAGITLLRALEIIEQQNKRAAVRRLIGSLRSGVKGGRSLSDCLAQYPRQFSPLYISMVRAGEESGRLKEAITAVVDHQRRDEEVASKVRMAMAYPLLMLVFGAGTIVFILTNVMPKITGVFLDLKQTLPVPTLLVMQASDFLIHWWAWLIGGTVLLILAVQQYCQMPAGRRLWHRGLLRLPVVGDFFLKLEMARFCRAVKLLIQSGIPIVRAIQIAIPVVGNIPIQNELRHCQSELIAGRSFGQTVRQSRIIPSMVGHLLSVGEESGSLVDTLGDIAESFENETNERIKILTNLLEPLLIVVVGSVVGFIVVAMLLPIFELNVFAS